MSTLDRYLLIAVISATALALMILLALGGFINFIAQVDDVGQASYTLPKAIVYVLLTVPRQAYDMLPIAALLGSLMGLGALASHSELVAMRAAGMSPWRFAKSLALAGALMTIVTALLGEFIAPPAEQFAKRHRALSLHERLNVAGAQSGWIREGDLIVNIERLIDRGRAGGIYLFRIDDDNRLLSVASAQGAAISDKQEWDLRDYRETGFEGRSQVARVEPRSAQQTGLDADLLALSVVDPEKLSGRGLLDYVDYLQRNGLDAHQYETALWSRVSKPLAVLVMCLLALPFVFTSHRAGGGGQRMLIGVLIGAAYVLASETLASSGPVYGLHPILAAGLPVLILFALTVFLLMRTR